MSCEDVQNDRRLFVEGNFINDESAPIAHVEVFTTFSANTNVTNTSNFIGQDFSDENGAFKLVSLVPRTQNMNLVLNRNNFNSHDTVVTESPYILFEIEQELLNDVDKISLDNFLIPNIANLAFTITKTSSDSAELNWSLSFNQFLCEQYITNLSELDNLSFCDDTLIFEAMNNDENPSTSTNITTVTNTTAVFTYSLNGQPEENILIPINDPSMQFEFEY